MLRDRRRLPWLVASAAIVALVVSDAFARAGGGGNFGGGGGGGGGFGGHGHGGGGAALLRLIVLCFEHPLVGIPFLLLVAYLLYRRVMEVQQGRVVNVMREGRAAAQTNVTGDVAARMRAHDPTFDPTAFDARVRAAFTRAQAAWCAQNLAPIRPFVSDGVYERFSMQIEEERALGYRDQMDRLAVERVTLVHCDVEGAFEVITARIAATCADYRVSLATGSRVSGDTAPRRFVEFWTFLRRRGAKSVGRGAGLLEGNCPNCGDSVQGNQFADCKSCHARLRSGEFDWVLAGITQGGEWAEGSGRDATGVATLAAGDPEFCVEAMEDRASVAFWRWATAMRAGDAKPLVGLATDEVVRGVAASWGDAKSARRYVGECGVGGVEMIGVVRDADVDHAVVEVRWSGTEFEVRPGAALRRLDRTGVRSWLLVFERSARATSRLADAFSSAHCRSCGGPAEGTASTCAYCGAALVDSNAGWTLARMTTRYEAAGRVLIDRLREAPVETSEEAAPPPMARPVAAGVVAWAARVAASDGVVDPRERAALASIASLARIPPERVDEIVRDALAPGGDVPVPESREEARAWLEFAARVAYSDGVLTPAEQSLLMRLANETGMSAADARILINRVKAQMYQEAKTEIARLRRE